MNKIETHLKNAGLKITRPRLKILDAFNAAEKDLKKRHFTAEEIHLFLLKSEDGVGFATVYRALLQFEEAGLILRHQFEVGKAVYELKSDTHHDHLICTRCGKVEEFFDAALEARQHEIAAEKKVQLRGHKMTLFVDCNDKNCAPS